MKKLLYFLLGVVIITVSFGIVTWKLSSVGSVHTTSGRLTIFNWGEYIDPQLLTKFEKETGYKVNYVTFDSNEGMYEKIKQGGTAYDIVVPSDYMVQKMVSENLLIKLDKSKIESLENNDPKLLNSEFDPNNNYSVPYFWGTLGIVYNDRYIKNSPKDWNDLWDSIYKDSILLTDSTRDVMGMGLLATGSSVNSIDATQVDIAYRQLLKLSPNIKAILGDEIMNYMINNEAPMAVVYSGQAKEMVEANENLHYVVPEKTNIWYDNLSIPKTSKNLEAAYAFINFMQKPENAAANADYVGYSTANLKAKEILFKDSKVDEEFYPDSKTIQNGEVYTNLPRKWTYRYNDLYLKFKMTK